MAKTVYKENTYKNIRKSDKPWVNQLLDFVLKDDRFRKILGFLLMIGSFALFVAFFSYLFTGKADQSIVADQSIFRLLFQTNLTETGREVDNWLGLTGAILSHLLMFKWFGLASFILVPLTFLVGWWVAFDFELLPINKSIFFSLFILLWGSMLLGVIFDRQGELGFWTGGFGYAVTQWLYSLIGVLTPLLILVFPVIFVIYFFEMPTNFSIDKQKFTSMLNDFKKGQVKVGGLKVKTTFVDPRKDKNPKTKITEPKDDFTRDIVLEINEDLDIEDHDKMRAFKTKITDKKPPVEKKNKANTKLELEIDPATPLSEESKQTDADNADFYPFPKIKNPGKQVKINFEEMSDEEIEQELNKLGKMEEEEVVIDKKNPEMEIPKDPIHFTEEEIIEENEIPETTFTNEQGLYDPTLELSKYVKPSPELLDETSSGKRQVSNEELEANKDKIVETLSNYGIGISQIKATIGPTVTLYEIIPEAGVRISKIKNLEDDIALSLAALGIRIIAPIPGKGTIGIEVPNKKREMVSVRSVLESDVFQNNDKTLPLILGKSVNNEVIIADLAKMPHILIAGATGQGKSVGLNVFLTSLIYNKHPAELKFVLIDPKKVELTLFNKIEKHFLAKLPDEEEAIITDTSKVINTLLSLCLEMDQRYTMLKEAACRNIKEYNKKFLNRKLNPKRGHKYLPYIVLVIDELADLMMVAGKEVEQPIARLAQLARAIGIHLIVATQRPSVNVITGIIKANFPARLSFKVTSKIDSRTILDAGGAEQLVGQGDLLFSMGSDMIRLQCPFIDTHEVERICDYINIQPGFAQAYELPEIESGHSGMMEEGEDYERDVLFEEAARIIVMHQQGSTSLLQRRLKLGYNRAGRLIDQLEKAGIVGPFEGSKAREVLIPDEYTLERLLSSLDK
ncbi:MAG: DNA translocase FtsK [Microscillaceae bacterium]|nr:DNA translocase FtsK [Microscillaceae bacterium]